jgi:hypothetical protein
MAAYKYPRIIEFADSLSKSATGKCDETCFAGAGSAKGASLIRCSRSSPTLAQN